MPDNKRSFADTLQAFLERSRLYRRQLAELTGIPEDTIDNWCDGVTKRPRDWQGLVKVANALQLTQEEADELLTSARHPTLERLRHNAKGEVEQALFTFWVAEEQATAMDSRIEAIHGAVVPPEGYTQTDLENYWRLLQGEYGQLRLPGRVDPVPLERIYVSLRADEMPQVERLAAYRYINDLSLQKEQQTMQTVEQDPYRQHKRIHEHVQKNPWALIQSIDEVERLSGRRRWSELSLAEVVQRHASVVLLGDPGSGKSTLCKWLAVTFGQAVREGKATVVVAADQVQPGEDEADVVDFGGARLPLLVRIADFARAAIGKGVDGKLVCSMTLAQFLCDGSQVEAKLLQQYGLTAPALGALGQAFVAAGKGLVILDGLDEVGDPTERGLVMGAVRAFVAAQTKAKAGDGRADNKVVLTSRPVGYFFEPLLELPHYVVEEMGDRAVGAFARAWLHHVAAEAEVEPLAEAFVERILTDSHPSVQTLGRNPLLLTLLLQVYHKNRGTVPPRRVALFAEVEATLYGQREAVWREVGIKPEGLRRVLGVVAMALHQGTSGFLTEVELREQLWQTLGESRQIEAVLQAAKDFSGFLMARGEGVYGFSHRSLQEYFVARHLTAAVSQAAVGLRPYVLQATWREPVLLGLGMLPIKWLEEAMTMVLTLPDVASRFLPHRELVAAAGCGECERVPNGIGRQIAERLLLLYGAREGKGVAPVLQQRIERAFLTLQQSNGRDEVEGVLCAGVAGDDFGVRYGALGLIRKLQWVSRRVARRLVQTWLAQTAPAGSLLGVLEMVWWQEPALFANVPELTVRRVLLAEPALWQRVWADERKRTALQLLCLPPGGSAAADVNREPAVAGLLLRWLRDEVAEVEVVDRLRQRVLAEDSWGRDAGLWLVALGETEGWLMQVAVAAMQQKNARTRVFFAIFAYFARDLALALDRDLALALARDLDRALDLDLERDLDLTLDRDFDRALDLDLERDLALASASARACDRPKEIGEAIAVATRRWQEDAEVMDALATASSRLVAWEVALVPQAGVGAAFAQLLAAYEQAAAANQGDVPEPAADSHLTALMLPDLAADLASEDDVRREQARQRLQPQMPTSTMLLGEAYVATLAQLAQQHEGTYQVGTQLEWGLHHLLFDEPAWLDGWLAAAAGDEEGWAIRLLGNVYYQSDTFFTAVLARLPQPQGHVNVALLHSWYWLMLLSKYTRDKGTPQPSEAQLLAAREKLLAWLAVETHDKTVTALLELLGAWREGETAVGVALLAANALGSHKAYPMALAKQAARVESVRPSVLAWLEGQPATTAVQAAWVRLQVAVAGTEEAILAAVQQRLPKPAVALVALLEAGINEDVWDDGYHGVLVGCGRRLIERQDAPGAEGLLAELLMRYEAALMDEEAWDKRRMTLALVAACLQVMPEAVQAAWATVGSPDSLESALIKGSKDGGSFNSRRFALTGLSYLREVSAAVVPVLISGLLDNAASTQRAAMKATERFQRIEPDVVAALKPYLLGESIQVAQGVAQMLGWLGTMAAAGDAALREHIAELLVAGLSHVVDTAHDAAQAEKIEALEEALSQALLRVRGVP